MRGNHGRGGPSSRARGGPSPAAGSGDWFAWPPPGAQAPDARIAAIVLFVYFFGTVAHVKAHIRERHNPAVQRLNVVYHVVGLGAAFAVLIALDGVAAGVALVLASGLLVLRSWLIPRRWPRITPKQLGLVEIGLTVVVAAVAIALGAAVA